MEQPGGGALPRTCRELWLGPDSALYCGPTFGLGEHSGAVACVVVALDGDLTFSSGGRTVTAGSVYVPPRRSHRVDAPGAMAVLFADPARIPPERAGALMRHHDDGVGHGHVAEDALRRRPVSPADAARWRDTCLGTANRPRSALAAAVAGDLDAAPDAVRSAGQVAAAVGLSESRLLHAVRDELGTSFRRYRRMLRLHRAVSLVAAGESLTTAAADAGFASPSHLSTAFRETFGFPPRLLRDVTVRELPG